MGRISDKRKSEEVAFRKLETQRLQQARRKAARDVATAHQRGEIPLDQVRTDCGTQSRTCIDPETRERYANAMREGAKFPPIAVFYDGSQYLLADGFHRVAAALDAGRVTLPVDIRQGTARDAILYSTGANSKHGKPRTRSDINQSITRLLTDEEWSRWSDRAIAEHVGDVSHVTVGKRRAELAAQVSLVNLTSERTYVNRYGQESTMQTANIGKNGRTNDRPIQPRVPEVPALPEDLPIELVRAVDDRRLSAWTAIQMADVLRRVPADVRELALHLDLDGTERIGILTNLYKRRAVEGSNATFDEIMLKGKFHYPSHDGQDTKECDFVRAPLHDVYAALKALSREHARMAAEIQHEARLQAAATPAPQGKYRCIAIDPPWPIEFIERRDRPAQGLYPSYATMPIEQIAALPVPDLAHDDGCHLYLWTTQKFLPDAIRLVAHWGFTYECLMTWVKPNGMSPYSWRYNTEHVVFARLRGLPLLKMGLTLSFEAPQAGHSIKPSIFYAERVLPVSPEPRLDMFARQQREGFVPWGYEAPAADREVSHA